MVEKRRRLEETARFLRSRLVDLERQRVSETERPMHEVALLAVRDTLTQVGRQLSWLDGAVL